MKIAKERHKTEFEIQAEAMKLLEDALGPNYIVRGEYPYRGCRFDLAIFKADSRDLVCTIEIKKRGGKKHVNQTNRYHWATGKPCVLLTEDTMRFAIGSLATRLKSQPFESQVEGSAPHKAGI